MKSLRLIWIAPINFQVPTERNQERTRQRRKIVTSNFLRNISLANASLSLIVMVIVSALAIGAFAQENTSADSSTPSVYSVENTGANFAAPNFPSFAQLPIIRPLPDPFRFVDG